MKTVLSGGSVLAGDGGLAVMRVALERDASKHGGNIMVFEDNFVQPISAWLIDPVLKVRMVTSAPRESYEFDEANLIITYDPEIEPGRLTQPPSAETRARRLAIPSLAHLADEPRIFDSGKSVRVQSIALEWNKPTDTLLLRVPYNRERMALWARGVANQNIPSISSNATQFLLYCIKSVVKLDHLRNEDVTKKCPQVRRIEVAVQTEVARDVFGLTSSELDEVEPGWVCVGSREIGQ